MEEKSEVLVFSVKETGKLLQLSRGAMYSAIKTGQLASIRIGKRILIPRRSLQKLLGESANPGKNE